MQIQVEPDIFTLFPEASFHGLIVTGLGRVADEVEADLRRQAEESVAASGIDPERLAEHPRIREWRDAYSKFGVKPSKVRSSIEQLYKRALKNELIRTRLQLVNLYCYLSVQHMLPAGGYNLASIRGDIIIRKAVPGDEIHAIGERAPWPCKPGTVCYADEAGVFCYAWNYRDAARTALSDSTQSAIFFADSASERSRQNATRALTELSEVLERKAGAEKVRFDLYRTQPSILTSAIKF